MNYLKKTLLVMTFSVITVSFSQETTTTKSYASATIDATYCMKLDASANLQEFYIADASVLNWASAVEAKKYCGYKSNNLITLEPNFEENKIEIHIWLDRTNGEKDLVWWNTYLESLCK